MKNKIKLIKSSAGTPDEYIKELDGEKIVDELAYKKFIALQNNEWLTKKRYYTPENDKLLNIDLLTKKRLLKASISHLPENERSYIFAIKHVCEQAYYTLTSYKNRALGNFSHRTVFAHTPIDDMIILDNRRADIMSLFGKMWTVDEVHKECVKDWGINVNIRSIEHFRACNMAKIIELQKEYTNNYRDVRLGYKKSRLEEYMWLYQDTKQSFEDTKNKDDRKFLKELLQSIKQEVEGDLIRIEGDMQLNIEQTLNVHIQKEIYSKLPINEMILTRVANKSNINPLLLLYRLQNSYYSKHTGFSNEPLSDKEELPSYPSSQIYDLDKLSVLNTAHNNKTKQKNDTFENFMSVSPEKKEKAKSIKQIIQDKILKKQQDLQKGIIKIEGKPKKR